MRYHTKEIGMAGEYSGDHRNGPLCVPGDQTPWGIRWYLKEDPEPWEGFGGAIEALLGGEPGTGDVAVFLHAPATARPTVSTGYGGYSYWRVVVLAGRKCYYHVSYTDPDKWDVHVAPVAPVE